MPGVEGQSEVEGGHVTTTPPRHHNDKTTSTKHTNKIIEYTKNTQTPPWVQEEVKTEQEGAKPGKADVEAKS